MSTKKLGYSLLHLKDFFSSQMFATISSYFAISPFICPGTCVDSRPNISFTIVNNYQQFQLICDVLHLRPNVANRMQNTLHITVNSSCVPTECNILDTQLTTLTMTNHKSDNGQNEFLVCFAIRRQR